ncbi:hypothetical protein RHMOL_Rhmol09G0169400 [Rhododendron molle]|uniref:Uncharacterized protein n=1 Tax=Rhododendron molle TaxID=49168 RepID=A0ACC0MEF0_RHOML|nr:hypothetical protein RHMOL_Rhmol09G0169400 [Rhododendron molle]
MKDFTLDISTNTPYEMHSCIYSCQELTQLKLVNRILRPPRELSDFQNVILLDFNRVTFRNNLLRTRLSRSGLLRRLTIQLCNGIGHLNIHAPNLEVLIINSKSGIDSLSPPGSPKLRFCLIALGKTMASLTRGKTPSLVGFLVELPRVSDLRLDIYFLEVDAAGLYISNQGVMIRLTPGRCKSLVVSNFGLITKSLTSIWSPCFEVMSSNSSRKILWLSSRDIEGNRRGFASSKCFYVDNMSM